MQSRPLFKSRLKVLWPHPFSTNGGRILQLRQRTQQSDRPLKSKILKQTVRVCDSVIRRRRGGLALEVSGGLADAGQIKQMSGGLYNPTTETGAVSVISYTLYWFILLIVMLCNLEELQNNLQSLLGELSDIHNKLINPIQAKKSNTHSFLIKLPKVILMLRVCPFLEADDIIQLSTVCVGIRKTIYSPIGWKLLSRVLTPYPLIIKEVFISENTKNGKFQTCEVDNFPAHMIEDEKLLKKARAECKKNLMQVYDKFKYKEEEHNELVHQLRS